MKRNLSQAFRREAFDLHGCKCVNCGSDRNVELHHIVPLENGGSDVLSNIAPVCHECHMLIHNKKVSEKTKNGFKTGRKNKISDDIANKAFNLYANGEIGNRKVLEMIGRRDKQFRNMAQFKAWKERNGICDIRNLIDVRGTNSTLYDGDCVGEITYVDGSVVPLFYHDTGLNDVSYVERGA